MAASPVLSPPPVPMARPTRTPPALVPAPFHLMALTPPRDSETPWEGHVRMIAGLCTDDIATDPGVALEIVGRHGEGVRFMARAADEGGVLRLKDAFGGYYPQSLVVDMTDPAQDPARIIAADPHGLAREFRLRMHHERPLATELAEETPWNVLGLVGTLYRLPAGMTAVLQLIVWPAPHTWGDELEARLEAVRRREHATGYGGDTVEPFLPVPILLGLLALGAPAALVYLYLTRMRDPLLLLVAAGVTVVVTGLGVLWWTLSKVLPPPKEHLVRAKMAVRGFICRLRVGVSGGTDAQRHQVLDAFSAALAGYGLPQGNTFVWAPCDHTLMHVITERGARKRWRPPFPLLNARGVGSIYLPPSPETEAPGIQRQMPWVLFPTDPAFRQGLHVGNTETDGLSVPVHLPTQAVDKGHMAVVGSSGGGKSVFLQRLIHEMEHRDPARPRPQVIVFDPHHALVRDILSWYDIDGGRKPIVIRLDDPAFKIGLNPLDVSTGRKQEQIVGAICTGFARYWDGSWGPRMEDVFRRAVETFYLVNLERAPEKQLTLLDITHFLQIPAKRLEVMRELQDFYLLKYWRDEFGKMSDQMFEAVIKPVLTKLNRFTTPTARQILSQPRSTIDIRAILRSGDSVFVDLNYWEIGEDTCSLLGSLLINDVCTGISEMLPTGRDALVVVDEFQMFNATWDKQFQAIRKRGGRMVVAAQGLSVIERVQEGLSIDVLNNTSMGTKVVFSSGFPDEAETLAKVLDDSVTAVDVQNLPVHTCYIKTTDGDRKLPVVTARIPLPPQGAPGQYDFLARATNRRYGTPVREVERVRNAYMRALFFSSHKDVHAGPRIRDADINGEMYQTLVQLAREQAACDGFTSPVPGDDHDPSAGQMHVGPGSTPTTSVGSLRPGNRDRGVEQGARRDKSRWTREQKHARREAVERAQRSRDDAEQLSFGAALDTPIA